MIRITESSSNHNHLETLSTSELLHGINSEDAKVAGAVHAIIPAIESFVDACFERMSTGGRLFYLGAGTSGRLGIVDASECPPTYGVPYGLVIGIIAGGAHAITNAVENAEDDTTQGWLDLQDRNITDKDVVIGIAASGSTPYVIGALVKCNEKNVTTACITCDEGSPLSKVAQYPIEAVVGPEFVTGSTRMKAGTAQKLILNMISTAVMIKLGKVRGNKMVDMKLSNNKLVDRGARMVMDELKIEMPLALELLKIHGSVRAAVDNYKK